MAPDAPTESWQPPEGYTLTVVPGHYIDRKGFASDTPPAEPMADDTQEVAHFLPERYVWEENDGRGPFASIAAREAALAGTPIAGWNPNVIHLPIKDGWVPDQFILTLDDDPTPVVEPASTAPVPLTPEEEIAALQAGIAAAEERIAELNGGTS